jgi:hypothetical protein
MKMFVTLPLGIVLGLILVFTHRSMKTKGIAPKIGIGIIAGFGICILLNAVLEVIGIERVF